MIRRLLIILILAFTMCPFPASAENKLKITGIYSDMNYNAEGGDLLGMEVFIMFSTDGIKSDYYATVQMAEGVPTPPVLIKAKINDDQIELSFPYGSQKMKFKGRVTNDGIKGKFAGQKAQIFLKRKQSHRHVRLRFRWERTKDCGVS